MPKDHFAVGFRLKINRISGSGGFTEGILILDLAAVHAQGVLHGQGLSGRGGDLPGQVDDVVLPGFFQ